MWGVYYTFPDYDFRFPHRYIELTDAEMQALDDIVVLCIYIYMYYVICIYI